MTRNSAHVRHNGADGAAPAAAVAVLWLPLPGVGGRGDGAAKTHTPLHLWFWAAYLMSPATPGISAAQLQRQLGIGR